MDSKLYQQNAPIVLAVFELLRRELEDESDDSPVLNRLHEISALPAGEFFEALGSLAGEAPDARTQEGARLVRLAPLGNGRIGETCGR